MYEHIPLPGERPYHPVIVKGYKRLHTPAKLRLNKPARPTPVPAAMPQPGIMPALIAVAGFGLLTWLLRD